MFEAIKKFLMSMFGRDRVVETEATDNDKKKYPTDTSIDTIADVFEEKPNSSKPEKTKHQKKLEERKKRDEERKKVKKIYVCKVGYKDKLIPENDLPKWIKKGWQKGRRPKEV
jgi:hypothetical protein